MKTVSCKDPKNFKLTKGNAYEVSTESDGYFHVVNDKGIAARYASNLFDVIESDIAAAPAHIPAPPPPPPARTEQDCIASINSAVNNSLTFIDIDSQLRNVNHGDTTETNPTNISCGVYQLSGINNIISAIDAVTEHETNDFIPLKKALFLACLRKRVQRANPAAMILVSTNIGGADYDHYYDVLDELSIMRSEGMNNPNSGNTIKVWGLQGHN